MFIYMYSYIISMYSYIIFILYLQYCIYIYLYYIYSYIYFLLLEYTLTGATKSLDSNGSATRGSNFMALPDCPLARCSLA